MPNPAPTLKRHISLVSAISLNVMNMIGVGPFITLPLVVGAMGGPQAILGWLLGAVIAVCDGLVWAELGAAMPRAGGSYAFLREIYRPLEREPEKTRDAAAGQGSGGRSDAPPAQLDTPSAQLDTPSAQLDTPSAQLDTPSAQLDTPSAQLDTPIEGGDTRSSARAERAARQSTRGSAGRFDLCRYLSFLYIWQLSFTAPLSIASGCIGLAQYAAYLWPALHRPVFALGFSPRWTSLLAASVCACTVLLLYRGVSAITRVAGILTAGVLATIGAVIVAGLSHMHASLLRFPAHALAPTHAFFQGLGFATLIATYDYWGYYNVCFLGAEVSKPGRTIPRAVLVSIALVATLYLGMHVAVLGVIPWQELVAGSTTHAAAAMLMERTFGHAAAVTISLLIMWTAFASVAALLLGYSRAPYAAAVDGNYFRAFARLHPRHGFPHISLLALGAAAMFFCFFDLAQVIAALVAVRIVLQYVLQQVGVMVLRWRQPLLVRPFRIWLYPMPPLVALTGFLFLLVSRKGAERELFFAGAVAVSGTMLFLLRQRQERVRALTAATARP